MIQSREFYRFMMGNQSYFYFAALLFAVGIAVGYGGSQFFESFIQSQLQGLKGIAEQLMQTDQPQLWFFVFIFFNNAIKAVMIIFLGAFFGILPIVFLLINGMVLGYISTVVPGDLWSFYLKGILPHGILEIPAIIIACGLGLRLGIIMMQGVISLGAPERRVVFSKDITTFLKASIPASIGLVVILLVAAGIESTITFWLVKE